MYSLTALKLSTFLKCAIYSMMCRGSVMDAVSTLEIVTLIMMMAVIDETIHIILVIDQFKAQILVL
jgi:hypothetical protein